MNKFSWYEAKSVEDAVKQANSTVSKELNEPAGDAAIFKSGGIDVWDLFKEGLIEPKTVVNVRNIPGLDKIGFSQNNGLSIGANVTLTEMEDSEEIKKNFSALQVAVAHAATPQLRNMSTLAGNLAQRTRCWYFRSSDHPCLRKGGDRCFARNQDSGENENHAILDNATCVSLHASSIATALLAYQASVVYVDSTGAKMEVPIEDFFVSPGQDVTSENILKPGDLITEIRIPTPSANTKSYYIKQVARESYDWSLADVAVVAEMSGKTCEKISIALGAAAPTPIRAYRAEGLLVNKPITEAKAKLAAEAAVGFARPLTMNGYKVPLFESIVKRALLEIA
ncbi:MAG: FAD binding domain-containing protein [Saprospiraceae bacterium]|nr:FAD binding domain-containing protein [Saprospiraceae bacterium]